MSGMRPRKRLPRRVAGLVLAVGVAAVAIVVGSPLAQADAPPGGIEIIRSWPTGLCVDGNDHAEGRWGGEAYSHECNLGRSQYWRELEPLRLEGQTLRPFANEYRLVAPETGFCLDSNESGAVYTLPCLKFDAYQSWIHVFPALSNPWPAGLPWPVIYQNMATHRCLSIGADHVLRTVPCGQNRTGQAWTDDMFFRRGY
jgi:hypothetical protein